MVLTCKIHVSRLDTIFCISDRENGFMVTLTEYAQHTQHTHL